MYDVKVAFCDSQSVMCPKVQLRYCNNTEPMVLQNLCYRQNCYSARLCIVRWTVGGSGLAAAVALAMLSDVTLVPYVRPTFLCFEQLSLICSGAGWTALMCSEEV